MDGKELTKNKEFTVKEGSIVVTLLPEFVENLSVGKHTLGIVSLSGTAVADFTVTEHRSRETVRRRVKVKNGQTRQNRRKMMIRQVVMNRQTVIRM